MSHPSLPADILNLTIPQRVQLVEQIWESIAAEEKAYELTTAQKKELDKRIEAHNTNPTQGEPWEDVKKQLLSE